ncbi:cobalamin-binding protein [candidate division NPL-UPA2 bacterium Unc8]|uniref:Cobalamin-binding protein n=1 Tax=candidate division NPL-UPA2 bacterium Unc8 TaxID=1980939 RepID=A0A399FYB1_UNCN2|nr:MAG: cobalamin-binding protein [candidate division NPL-UPA2 bacterium Unc8]
MKHYIRWCIPTLLMVAFSGSAAVYPVCPPPPVPGVFVDDLGRTVDIEEVPQRIVSLAPSNTEILFALGLGNKVVGVTEFCNYPETALDIEKVGGWLPFDLERVVALEPDLVLAAALHERKGIPALERVDITVFALVPKTLNEVLSNITLVGEITGKSEKAIRLVTDLEDRIRAITEKTMTLTDEQRPRVLYIVWHDPLLVAGSGTFADDLINKAGGKNIAYDLTQWAGIDLETVIARNPQLIIAPHRAAGVKDKLRLGLGVTDAFRENRVYLVEEDLFDRPGPRLVDALEELTKFIHPELFGE